MRPRTCTGISDVCENERARMCKGTSSGNCGEGVGGLMGEAGGTGGNLQMLGPSGAEVAPLDRALCSRLSAVVLQMGQGTLALERPIALMISWRQFACKMCPHAMA